MNAEAQRILGQRKVMKSALERIETLEQEVPRIIGAVNEVLTQSQSRQQGLAEVVEALVESLGADTVDAKIEEIRARKLQQAADQAKANLEEGLKTGKLLPATTIEEDSLVVGREVNAEGGSIPPGRVQLKFTGIKPEFQEKLKGQGVGFSVETPGGGKLEVLEVYKILPELPPAPEAPAADAAPVEVKAEAVPAPAETPADLEAALTPEA